MTNILLDAHTIINGNRSTDYGSPTDSFTRIATIANAMTGLSLTPQQCCMVLMAVKLTRQSYKHKRDNLVDLCGYAHLLNELERR
jgi:hypothetical protein